MNLIKYYDFSIFFFLFEMLVNFRVNVYHSASWISKKKTQVRKFHDFLSLSWEIERESANVMISFRVSGGGLVIRSKKYLAWKIVRGSNFYLSCVYTLKTYLHHTN